MVVYLKENTWFFATDKTPRPCDPIQIHIFVLHIKMAQEI
jgi:hypothetical protein